MAITPQIRLKRWLKKSGLKQVEAAGLIGIDPSVFTKYLLGKRVPGRDAAVQIKRVTGIQIEDWVSIVPDVSRPAAETDAVK